MSTTEEDALARQHLERSAVYLSASSAFLAASALSAYRTAQGTIDILASCSACAAPRQFSTYRSTKASQSRKRRKSKQPGRMRALCGLCGHQEALPQWDKSLWNTLRRAPTPSPAMAFQNTSQPTSRAIEKNPLIMKATAETVGNSNRSSKESSPAVSASDQEAPGGGAASTSQKRRKRTKKEGLQALLAQSNARNDRSSSGGNGKQTPPGLSSLFAQLQ